MTCKYPELLIVNKSCKDTHTQIKFQQVKSIMSWNHISSQIIFETYFKYLNKYSIFCKIKERENTINICT